jgi:predicted aspartyl protease
MACGLALMAALPGPLARAACSIASVAQLPVEMQNLTPLVAVSINGIETRLIADTGAFYSMLSPGKAAELKLPLDRAPDWLRGVSGFGGGSASVSVTRVKVFGLAGATLHNVEFIVGGNEFGYESAGLLGENLWSKYDAEYDLGHGVIRLFETHDCRKASMAYWADPTHDYSELDIESVEFNRFHIIGQASVNGSKIRVMFDTGASTSMLSQSAAARAGINTDDPAVRPGGWHHGIGRGYV